MQVWQVLERKGREVHTIGPGETLADAVTRFVQGKVRALVVAEDDRVRGMLAIRDVLAQLARRGADALDDAVSEAMTAEVVTVTADRPVSEIEQLFVDHRIQHLPVVEVDLLVGMLTPADVLTRHLESVQETNSHLLRYISGGYC